MPRMKAHSRQDYGYLNNVILPRVPEDKPVKR
jgi:hypothetical protein